MTISFDFFEYELVFIIVNLLWIIQGCSFIAGSQVLKRDLNTGRFLQILFIAGCLLTIWAITTFFLPTSISSYSPTESEELLYFVLPLLLYNIIPGIIFIILGVSLFIFFYKNNHLYQKLLVYTSILFLGGYIIKLVISVVVNWLINYDVALYIDLVDLFLALNIISLCITIIAVLILILFSIYINNRYFIVFSSLYLAQLFYILIPILPHI